jgi:hypothetical protein
MSSKILRAWREQVLLVRRGRLALKSFRIELRCLVKGHLSINIRPNKQREGLRGGFCADVRMDRCLAYSEAEAQGCVLPALACEFAL